MKIQKRFIVSLTFTLMTLSIGLSAYAQELPRRPGDDTVYFISSEMSFDGKVVKGAPYSAQAITETTQTLNDGNHIKRTNTATVYRDGEGRTRREQQLGAVGPWAVSGEPQQTVLINDPIAGINYILEPRTRTARKMPLSFFKIEQQSSNDSAGVSAGTGAGVGQGGSPKVSLTFERNVTMSASTGAGPLPPLEVVPMPEFNLIATPNGSTTESLGKQTIEGVVADGTRTTVTIPAGKIGNEQPIQITFEKWFSPELQTVVMSKHSDPFVGETLYRLTNIVRSEPAHTLFEVPADYTIQEIPVRTRIIRKKSGEEEK
jgi:hypothetical protein